MNNSKNENPSFKQGNLTKEQFLAEASKLFDESSTDKTSNTLLIKGKKKANINKPFVMVFHDDICEFLIKKQLSQVDMTVLFAIMKYLNYGNLIRLSQNTIALELGIKRQMVNRSFKKLEELNILFSDKDSLFMNPNYIVKGDMYKSLESEAYKQTLNRTYKELKQYLPEEELNKVAHEKMSFVKGNV